MNGGMSQTLQPIEVEYLEPVQTMDIGESIV
jgi:hypothetical protein